MITENKVEDDPAMNGTDAERERFEDILGDTRVLLYKIYRRNKHFKPDENAFNALINLYNELKQYKRKGKW
jgi:hypothetical protein